MAEFKAALEISRQMMDRDPVPGALIIHAQALDRLGEPKEALDTMAGYLERQPDDRGILASAAGIAAGHEQYFPVAVTYYQRLYGLDRDPRVRRQLEAAGIPESLQRSHSAPGRGSGRVSRYRGLPGLAVLSAAGLPGGQRYLPASAGEERRKFRTAPGGGQGRRCRQGFRPGPESVSLALCPQPGPKRIRLGPGPARGPKGQSCRSRGGCWAP